MAKERVAVFIDTENLVGWIKKDGLRSFLADLKKQKDTVCKAYADWSQEGVAKLQKSLIEQGIELVHTYHVGSKKNSADIHLAMDIIESALLEPEVSTYVLMTGDADFSPVFRRLHQLKKKVWGVGPESTLSNAVSELCARYTIITNGKSAEAGQKNAGTQASQPKIIQEKTKQTAKAKQPVKPKPLAGTKALKQANTQALNVLRASDKPLNSSHFKNLLLAQPQGFNEKELGFKTFHDFLKQVPTLVLQQEGKAWFVDIKPTGQKAVQNGVQSQKAGLSLSQVYENALKKSKWPQVTGTVASICFVVAKSMAALPKNDIPRYISSRSEGRVSESEAKKAVSLFFKAHLFCVSGKQEELNTYCIRDGHDSYVREIDKAMFSRIIRYCDSERLTVDKEVLRQMSYGKYEMPSFTEVFSKAEAFEQQARAATA